MFTLFELSYNEKNGLTKYSIVRNGPIAYIETTQEVAEQIIKALNNQGMVTFKSN